MRRKSPYHRLPEGNVKSLLHASCTGDVQDVKRLIDLEVDINAHDDRGMTALHYAASRGHADIIRLLVQSGATYDLPEFWDSDTPLHWAAANGHITAAKELLLAGASISADNDGYTPLHLAAIAERVKIVKLLVRNGADPKVADNDGHTAVWHARDARSPNDSKGRSRCDEIIQFFESLESTTNDQDGERAQGLDDERNGPE